MEKLNTHEGLYSLLVRSLDRYDAAAARSHASSGLLLLPEQPSGQQEEQGSVQGYTEEAVRVGRSLRRDFEKAGIHLPEHQRVRLVELTGLERRLGIAIGLAGIPPTSFGQTAMFRVFVCGGWQIQSMMHVHCSYAPLLTGIASAMSALQGASCEEGALP